MSSQLPETAQNGIRTAIEVLAQNSNAVAFIEDDLIRYTLSYELGEYYNYGKYVLEGTLYSVIKLQNKYLVIYSVEDTLDVLSYEQWFEFDLEGSLIKTYTVDTGTVKIAN